MIRAFSERYLHKFGDKFLLEVTSSAPVIVAVNLDPVVDVHGLVRHRLEVREPHGLRRSVLLSYMHLMANVPCLHTESSACWSLPDQSPSEDPDPAGPR
jgi:hypothetical protein